VFGTLIVGAPTDAGWEVRSGARLADATEVEVDLDSADWVAAALHD
jgi:hypothetical protein